MKFAKSGILKTLVVCLLILTLVGLTACGGSKEATNGDGGTGGGSVTLKLAHFLPPMHFYNTVVVDAFVEEVEELTEGRVKFDVYAAASLGDAENHYDMAATGVADIAISLQSYTEGKFPLSSVVELPFISQSAEMGTEILYELYNKFPELQEEYADTKVLWLFQNDAEYVLTTDKAVNTLEEMNGLRIRVASDMTRKAVDNWGGSPMFMPMPDVYDSAQRGVIDGATGPLSAIESFRLADVIHNITEGPFTITNFFAVMNKNAWNKLSPEDQEIIEGITEKYRKLSAQEYDKAGERGRQIAEEAGTQFNKLTDAEQKKFEEALADTYQEWVDNANKRGLPGDEILEEARRLSQEYRK